MVVMVDVTLREVASVKVAEAEMKEAVRCGCHASDAFEDGGPRDVEVCRAEGRGGGFVRSERAEDVVGIADCAVGDGGVGMSATDERDVVCECRCLDRQEGEQER